MCLWAATVVLWTFRGYNDVSVLHKLYGISTRGGSKNTGTKNAIYLERIELGSLFEVKSYKK